MLENARSLTRRTFLRNSAGAVAGATLLSPTIVPSSVFGANAPSNRVTVGMIGMGRQAYYSNVKSFLSFPDVQVVAVCDVDAWRLESGRKAVEDHYAKDRSSGTFKGCAVFRDFREVLARKDIDAVMISTPDHWHVPISIAAVKAGKDVSCEKPVTLCIDEGRLLSDRSGGTSGSSAPTASSARSPASSARANWCATAGSASCTRSAPACPSGDVAGARGADHARARGTRLRDVAGPGPVAPYTVNRVHGPTSYERPGWMRIRDYCDGMITNWGTHLNDIAQWGNGTERTGPVEVEGSGKYPPRRRSGNVLLSFEVRYRYANGVQLFYKTSRPYVRFEGSEGWIEANYSKRTVKAEPQSVLDSPKADEMHFPLKDEKRDFIDAVKTRGQTLEDAEVGHRTTSLCHLGHIAIQVGHKLAWDPQAERFTNDEAANRLLGRPMRSPWSLG